MDFNCRTFEKIGIVGEKVGLSAVNKIIGLFFKFEAFFWFISLIFHLVILTSLGHPVRLLVSFSVLRGDSRRGQGHSYCQPWNSASGDLHESRTTDFNVIIEPQVPHLSASDICMMPRASEAISYLRGGLLTTGGQVERWEEP